MADLFKISSSFKPRHVAGVNSTRFIEPHDCEEIDAFRVKYSNAERLVANLGDLPLGFRAFALLDGKFIFGDFIEALIVKNDWLCEELTISTLSMSLKLPTMATAASVSGNTSSTLTSLNLAKACK